jgi:DNA-binding SARP family transcriptional activator
VIIFRLLGPVGLADQPDNSVVSRVRGVRAVLATLLHNANQHVTIDRLAEWVWVDPPASAHANLRTKIAALRRALEESSPGLGRRLETRRGGRGEGAAYRLTATPDEIDTVVFNRLADRGRDALRRRRSVLAADTLRAALALWRGPIGEDLPDTPALRGWAAELNERRLIASDDLAEARLPIAGDAGLIPDLRRQQAANPHRERTAELLVRALHASGDRSGAMAFYQRFRDQLVDELGIEPCARLQRVHLALLRDEPEVGAAPSLRTGAAGQPRRPPASRRRARARRP